MIRQNMGRLDRTLRFAAAVTLIPVGLFALGGWQAEAIGLAVAAVALVPLVTSLTGICPGYIPFGISTLGGESDPVDRQVHVDEMEAQPK